MSARSITIGTALRAFLFALALALLFTMTVVSPPANATSGCATRAEFDKVKQGMSKARVHSLFDTRGVFMDGGAGGYVRYYPSCRTASIAIEYAVGSVARVGSKTWMRDSPGIVTRREFRMIKEGMARKRVHRIFDTRGHVVIPAGGNHPYESREYRMFNGCTGIDFEYRDGAARVVGKYRGDYCVTY